MPGTHRLVAAERLAARGRVDLVSAMGAAATRLMRALEPLAPGIRSVPGTVVRISHREWLSATLYSCVITLWS